MMVKIVSVVTTIFFVRISLHEMMLDVKSVDMRIVGKFLMGNLLPLH